MGTYNGIIYPHIKYGIMFLGCAPKVYEHVTRLLTLQNTIMRIIGNFQIKDSFRNTFKILEMLTSPSLFILQTYLLKKFKCKNNVGTKTFHPLYTPINLIKNN